METRAVLGRLHGVPRTHTQTHVSICRCVSSHHFDFATWFLRQRKLLAEADKKRLIPPSRYMSGFEETALHYPFKWISPTLHALLHSPAPPSNNETVSERGPWLFFLTKTDSSSGISFVSCSCRNKGNKRILGIASSKTHKCIYFFKHPTVAFSHSWRRKKRLFFLLKKETTQQHFNIKNIILETVQYRVQH